MTALSESQKAAAVLISLGSETAAQVFKFLSEEEIEKLIYEITRTQKLGSDDVESILGDFYSLCLTQKVVTEGGVSYARNVLEKAFGPQAAQSLIERATRSPEGKAFEFIRKADYKSLLAIIQGENPQTIALVLSYARSDQASCVISELPKEVRAEVAERIARMDRPSPEVIRQVEKALERRFSALTSAGFTEAGGINHIAEIMSHIGSDGEKNIFEELYRRDAGLADEIRKKMPVPQDIDQPDNVAIQE